MKRVKVPASTPASSAFPTASTPDDTRRRSFLIGMGAVALSTYGSSGMAAPDPTARAIIDEAPPRNALGIRALVFDVYGTCTDYWSTILVKGAAFNRENGVDIDWNSVARDWNPLYPSGFRDVVSGARAWQSPSLLREEALAQVLQRHGYPALAPGKIVEFSALWNALTLWDDVLPGLERLHRRYPLACLSNADMAAMVALARYRHLPWDLVLTGEVVEQFKPAPDVYKLAPRFLNLKPEETLMVACHKADLLGARAIGMRTAFVRRPKELGAGATIDVSADSRFDVTVDSMLDLDKFLQHG